MRDISLETVIVALTYIDAHDRDTWLKVGNALKTEFGEAAFVVFDNWSQTADNYDAKAVKNTWKGYTLGKNRMGTIIHHAKQNGFDIDKYESKPVSPQEQAERQAKRQQAEREAEALEQAEKVVWAKLLPQIGQATNTALSTPFSHDKGISTTSTSSIHSNELHAFKHPFNTYNGKPESIGYALKGLITLVPYLDLKTGELVKLQGISGIKATEGKEAGKYIKRFIGKGEGYYWRGDILNQDAPKVIVEGFSDAQTIHEYTEQHHASLAAGNDSALMKAALALRALCPSAVIIVFGDNDANNKGQRLAKAAALAINGICLLPPSQYKDANEWVLAEGAEGLNKMIDEAIQTKKAVPPSEDGTAPNTQISKPIIDDDLGGGEDKVISHMDDLGHKKSQPTVLIEMADDCELFHTSDDEAYAVVKTPTSRQVFAVRSAGFRRYLSQRYFKLFGKGVGNQALQDALITIEAKANFNGTLRQVYKRVANLGDRIYLDLCDEKWRVIEVTAAGWQVLNCSPVMFTRTKDMLSIPEPKNDASDAILSVNDLVKNKEEKYKNIYLLKRFVNVRDEDYPLIYAFILACLRGIKPYPVLLLQGESGTGKTTTARNMRGLIDPSKADVLGKPKDENELKTCANNSYILAIDNLSGLSKDFSDVVCQIATGASSSKRKLYTDNDVETYEIARPIILNGIDDIASRGDLLNRSFQVNLPALNDDKKGDEQELATQYNQAKPVILAAFLDMLSVGLRDYDKIEKIKTSGRFVSLPRFVTAAERGLGLSELFAKTYDQNTKQGVELALETSPLAQALITFMSLKTIWTGTIGELFQQLNDRFKTDSLTLQSGSWPKTPRYLSGELTRLAPQLRQTHIDIKTKKESHGMTITLEKVRKIASLASLASLNNKNNELQDESSVIVASGLHHSSVINNEVASFSIIEESSHIKGCDANDANDARFSKDSNNGAMTWEADL